MMSEHEPVPDPDLPIIDPHHHLYPYSEWIDGPYLLEEFAADLQSGHNVVATVYVECSQLYRRTGPEYLGPIGEIEFAAVMGRLSDTGHFGSAQMCAGVIGRAPLEVGERLDELLDALIQASDGRLRGIRQPTTWDQDTQVTASRRPFARQGLMSEPGFRAGVRQLAHRGLAYDSWLFYPQLGELAGLADAVPEATIVSNHCGGLVGTRAYSGPQNFTRWRALVLELAKRPNVLMKLGGLANDRTGFGFQSQARRPTEDQLIAAWTPYVITCIEAFGAERCMFESNFPVDRCAADYRTLWTVFKRIAAGASATEKAALFAGTARRAYRLDNLPGWSCYNP